MGTGAMRRYTRGDGLREPRVSASVFAPAGGVRETHLTVQPAAEGGFAAGTAAIAAAYRRALDDLGVDARSAIFRRLFASDLADQAAALASDETLGCGPDDAPLALSLVEEPPFARGGAAGRLALWAWHLDEGGQPLARARHGRSVHVARGGRTHVWTTGVVAPGAADDVGTQTDAVFRAYEAELAAADATLARDALRTWVFVRDIDRDYGAMVDARRALFTARGLTADTRYIASTGVEGRAADATARVLVDGWAVAGLVPTQLRQLSAPDHLGKTSAYGVTFERGTAVHYGDRRHVIVSGTASIDSRGAVLHTGDLAAQLARSADNFAALLADAGATPADLAQILVYVRAAADAAEAHALVEARFPAVPCVLVRAPICRPTWLVEIEGLALVATSDPNHARY